jgi:hypothetical protein
MAEKTDAADPVRCVHFAHCFQGDYRHACKYGDDDCPAAVNDVPDHPNDRDLDFDERAIALVRFLARSTEQSELEQAREWACQLILDMEK